MSRGKLWSDEERKFLKECVDNGLTNDKIAVKMGRTKSAIESATSVFGLQRDRMVALRMNHPSGEDSPLWKGGLTAAYARYYATHKEDIAIQKKDYRANNPEKLYAQNVIGDLVRRGKIPKLSPGMNRHHPDYSKAEKVKVLSCSDHVKLHQELKKSETT